MSHDPTPTPAHTHCQNCGTPLAGPYCSACGQRDVEFHQSFRAVFHEAIETWFHVDHSFFHGFYTLLFQPGQMTRDVNAGRRVRHVPAFRFYLVASILFFFVFMPHGEPVQSGPRADRVVFSTADGREGHVDPAEIQLDLPLSPERERAVREALAEAVEHPGELMESFAHKLPKALILLVPVFALFTRFAYGRARYLYLQHLVLSVHVHTFFLIATVALYGLAQLLGLIWSGFAPVLACAGAVAMIWHYYATLHRVFETSRLRALVLGSLVAGVYGILVATTLVSTLLATLLWH